MYVLGILYTTYYKVIKFSLFITKKTKYKKKIIKKKNRIKEKRRIKKKIIKILKFCGISSCLLTA